MAQETDAEFEARMLSQYRDALVRQGMPRAVIDAALRVAFTPSEVQIETEDDYIRAAVLHELLAKDVHKGEWGTPHAVRLYALGGEMARFENEFRKEHGRLPRTEKD